MRRGRAAFISVRAARDDDGPQLMRLIGGVFAEYPGCVLDVDGEMPELRAIRSTMPRVGGAFWVAEQDQRVVGCVGYVPTEAGVELKKLYVELFARRGGLASRLCALVEEAARVARAPRIELWSDTRFIPAHRFYEARGYVKTGQTRELFDQSATVEYHFSRDLSGAGVIR
ncbi:MAG: GNAT family N-acetyltransferase [Polyangiaceae bacterium]|nr:GNAT family N-acetyltransferase [Polyangiaceae bacterium]